MNARRVIRGEVVSRLQAAPVTLVAPASVFDSRVWTFEKQLLPAINVATTVDVIDVDEQVTGRDTHRLALFVMVHAAMVDGVAAGLDDVCDEVFAALFPGGEEDLGGLVQEVDLVSIDLELSAEEDEEVAQMTIEFSVLYATAEYGTELVF